ncbi:branched-chain amino acid ABC transporter [Methylobacterium indicum]|uniref:Branched-chain amino acid ABC transporter n=1 Tax=Methylobacterium indicum TaxID=1775910 RepID=A0ABR5GQY6_9HYPH|nr:AzlD domain-containing protein [Methylobacterium indicum]KMO11533.1 branched-chain amino acid ABC transporter [Methylobacterium indicum]KMO11788.1 branched-chain amino acid ABC transporter [Methylobacterium indicum]KTS14485.1 branched-chain amino acid ABC transporter [Methylobacterium indicum]KTS31400.1 branched-chain amino acid ABC transporter [Methylobacterium indicum]KTS48578.1 branched-chain amino acid ABC transporter [Methylobacterium indicum]
MIDALLAGPAGPWIAILALALVTYLCRASGVVLMSRVRLTPRVERGLRALPGSIVVATALPTGLSAGLPGLLGLVTAAGVMALTRFELAAVLAGLGVVALGRLAGL